MTFIHIQFSIQHVHHYNSLIVNMIAKHISQEYLSYENCPATSYVAATFHPTIGQCDHQSLSNTATLELGMISTRNKGNTSRLTRSQGYAKLKQANTVGFIRL